MARRANNKKPPHRDGSEKGERDGVLLIDDRNSFNFALK